MLITANARFTTINSNELQFPPSNSTLFFLHHITIDTYLHQLFESRINRGLKQNPGFIDLHATLTPSQMLLEIKSKSTSTYRKSHSAFDELKSWRAKTSLTKKNTNNHYSCWKPLIQWKLRRGFLPPKIFPANESCAIRETFSCCIPSSQRCWLKNICCSRGLILYSSMVRVSIISRCNKCRVACRETIKFSMRSFVRFCNVCRYTQNY